MWQWNTTTILGLALTLVLCIVIVKSWLRYAHRQGMLSRRPEIDGGRRAGMRRTLFVAVSALSLVMSFLLIRVWIYSYQRMDTMVWTTKTASDPPTIRIVRINFYRGALWIEANTTTYARPFYESVPAVVTGVRFDWPNQPEFAGSSGRFLGFGVYHRTVFLGYARLIAVAIPLWSFVGLAVVLPFCWDIVHRRRLHRIRLVRVGRCPMCGYDLRASSERCPECGVAIVGGGVG